jgi:SOS-response transcriptional repressor LexA
MNNSPNTTNVQALEKRGGIEMIAEMTKAVLSDRGWSYRQADLQTGVNFSTIRQMANGLSVKPESLREFAQAVGQDPDVWMIIATTKNPGRYMSSPDIDHLPAAVRSEFEETQKLFRRSENIAVPLLGRIAAGSRDLAEQNHEGDVWVSRDDLRGISEEELHTCFAVRVVGESMKGAAILEGDLVILRNVHDAEDGQIVAACWGEMIVIKRLRKPGATLAGAYLESELADGTTERHEFAPGDGIIGVSLAIKRLLP